MTNTSDAVHSALMSEVQYAMRHQCIDALRLVLDEFCNEHHPFLMLLDDPTGVGTLVDALEYIVAYFKDARAEMEKEYKTIVSPEQTAVVKEALLRIITMLLEKTGDKNPLRHAEEQNGL